MGYVVAAYAIVIGALLVYGLRVQAERRALARAAGVPPEGATPRESDRRP